jgi:aminopeptidase N
LAQFSGLWYLNNKSEEDEKYIDILKEWRESILSNRKYLFDSGQEAGPIWMGYRTSSSNTQGDYNLIIYRKGAWVLHMLRMMMMDWQTKNDQSFIDMMRDFYQPNFLKKVSTDDFKKVVEKHFDQNMDWFFKQWIYGTDIPTYKYAYKISQNLSGEYTVRLRVKQEDCSQDFKMRVPLKIEFKKKEPVFKKIWIEGFESAHEITGIKAKPRKVILNCDEAVLCKVKKENWK